MEKEGKGMEEKADSSLPKVAGLSGPDARIESIFFVGVFLPRWEIAFPLKCENAFSEKIDPPARSMTVVWIWICVFADVQNRASFRVGAANNVEMRFRVEKYPV